MSSKSVHILAIDEGTTGTSALVMNQDLEKIAESSLDFEQHFPKPGWVEHDLDTIWTAVVHTIGQACSKIDVKTLAALGSTNPYFSGTKVRWAIKNWPAVHAAYKKSELAVGTIDSYLIYRLTDGAVHATEPSNASRTLAFDLKKFQFTDELCRALEIKKEIWPEVKPSTAVFGKTKNVPGLPDGIPISGVLGDQQSALLGQACIEPGLAKCTYGTGAFLLMNTGSKIVRSKHRLLSTVAWDIQTPSGFKERTYALEGSAFVAGAAVQWLRDGLGLIRTSEEIESLAASVESAEGVTFVPALAGLGAPYWNPHARGIFTGITRGTTKAHFARAVLEGIAFQNVDLLTAMQKDVGKKLKGLNVDGGAAANNLLMQLQADYLGVTLSRPNDLETTSLGAVFAAGLGVGIWKTPAEVKKSWKKDRDFKPKLPAAERAKNLRRWADAVKRSG